MLKYTEKSLRIFIPNEDIEQETIEALFNLMEETIFNMIEKNTFKSFQVTSMITEETEIKGRFYFVYNINGFFPPHTINSILNLFKYIASNMDGLIAVGKEYIDNMDIKWDGVHTQNIIFKLLKANEKIDLDIEHHTKAFNIFIEKVESP